MRIPKEFKYRNSTITISKVPIKEARKGQFYAIYDPNDNSIKISEEVKNKVELAETLLHEILHVIVNKAKLEVASEERTVDSFARELTILLFRNRHILTFIERCLKPLD